MDERLGLATIPGAGWSAEDIRSVAREAEAAGFDGIFVAEVNNDALATAQLMGTSTERITVGTWVANIYLRHPYLCAQAAALIAEATGGRFVLGLGASHAPVNSALGVDMGNPVDTVGSYATAVQAWLRGEGPATHLPQRAATTPVPVYAAALTSKTVKQAAAICDGIMPLFWSPERVERSKAWTDGNDVELTLGLPTFLGDDLGALYEVARANLGLYTTLPFFRYLFRVSGFEAEAQAMEQGAGGAALSERLLESVCLLGPLERCRERLAAYRAAGVQLPILMPPIGVDGPKRHHGLLRELTLALIVHSAGDLESWPAPTPLVVLRRDRRRVLKAAARSTSVPTAEPSCPDRGHSGRHRSRVYLSA